MKGSVFLIVLLILLVHPEEMNDAFRMHFLKPLYKWPVRSMKSYLVHLGLYHLCGKPEILEGVQRLEIKGSWPHVNKQVEGDLSQEQFALTRERISLKRFGIRKYKELEKFK